MNDQLRNDPHVQWTWSISTPGGQQYGVRNVGYQAARAAWDDLLGKTQDEALRGHMERIGNSFGVMSITSGGYNINTSATMPQTTAPERHWCPRRNEGGPGARQRDEEDRWHVFPNGQRTCSYCGSLHPDDMLALLEQYGLAAIDRSDKTYKWYLSGPHAATNAGLGPIKYYRMHDTPELVAKVQQLTVQRN